MDPLAPAETMHASAGVELPINTAEFFNEWPEGTLLGACTCDFHCQMSELHGRRSILLATCKTHLCQNTPSGQAPSKSLQQILRALLPSISAAFFPLANA